MDWKQELFKRLDALAEKLGTTAAYLWSVLVRQAVAEGVGSLVTAVAMMVGVVVLIKLAGKAQKHKLGDVNNDGFFNEFVGWFLLPAAATGAFAIGIACLIDGFQHLYNPAYFALHEILNTLGK